MARICEHVLPLLQRQVRPKPRTWRVLSVVAFARLAFPLGFRAKISALADAPEKPSVLHQCHLLTKLRRRSQAAEATRSDRPPMQVAQDITHRSPIVLPVTWKQTTIP